MIDHYLHVLFEQEKKASAREQMVDAMMKLPDELLHRIAMGEKIAMCEEPGGWLDKFQGTALHEQALQLEQQQLELDIQRQQARLEEMEQHPMREQLSNAEDQIRVQKKILELELSKSELQRVNEPTLEAPPSAEPPPAPPVTQTSEEKMKVSSVDEAVAIMKRAAKKAPHEHFEDEIREGIEGGPNNARALALAQQGINRVVQDWGNEAAWAQQNPALSRLRGAGVLGGLGAGGGALLGMLGGRPGVGALVGGGAGALLGAHMGSASRLGKTHQELLGAQQGLQGPLLEKALLRQAIADKDDPAMARYIAEHLGDPMPRRQAQRQEKRASSAEAVAAMKASMEKEAILGAAMMGLRGAGSFLSKAAPLAANAAQHGGVRGLGAALKPIASHGIGLASNFAKVNPLAAGAIGAGALGTAALAGGAADRMIR